MWGGGCVFSQLRSRSSLCMWRSGVACSRLQSRVQGHDAVRRSFSTVPPDLKDQLRSLFKLVHPDLFASFPKEQRQNEKALQTLQAFLDTANGSHAPEKFPLLFRLRPKESDSDTKLRSVSLTLHSGGTPKQHRQELSRLFSALGLGSEFSGGTVRTNSGLESFLASAVGDAEDLQEKSFEKWRKVQVAKHRLRLRHPVTLTFDQVQCPDLCLASVEQILDSDVDEILREIGHELHGGKLRVGTGTSHVDWKGDITLSASETAKDWSHFLRAQCKGDLNRRRELLRSLRKLERRAASATGLAYVHGDDSVEDSSAYLAFLRALVSRPHNLPGSAVGKLVLLVIPPVDPTDPAEPTLSDQGQVWLQRATGVVVTRLPGDLLRVDGPCLSDEPLVAEGVDRVLDYLNVSWPSVMAARHTFLAQREMLRTCITNTTRELEAEMISMDPALGAECVAACCRHLVQDADRLKTFTRGLHIRVATEYALREDGSLEVPWDFAGRS